MECTISLQTGGGVGCEAAVRTAVRLVSTANMCFKLKFARLSSQTRKLESPFLGGALVTINGQAGNNPVTNVV
jgi:hypothetical protein